MLVDEMPGVCTGRVLNDLWDQEEDEWGEPAYKVSAAEVKDELGFYGEKFIIAPIVLPTQNSAAKALKANGFKDIGTYRGNDGTVHLFVRGLRLNRKRGLKTRTRKRP